MVDEVAELCRAGRQLFDSLHIDDDPYSLTVLIVEACRVKDRLDLLNRLNSGDEDVWFDLVASRGSDDVLEIKIDSGLQEARQLASVLRQLLAEIRRLRGEGTEPKEDDDLAGIV